MSVFVLDRQKRVKGFATGDLVEAAVPAHLKTRGSHRGRVAVRATGSFRVGTVDGINAKYCRLLQRGDGYLLTLLTPLKDPSTPKQGTPLSSPGLKDTGYPEAEVR